MKAKSEVGAKFEELVELIGKTVAQSAYEEGMVAGMKGSESAQYKRVLR